MFVIPPPPRLPPLERLRNVGYRRRMSRDLSARQARRIALAAQGLAAPRSMWPVTRRVFRKLAGELGVIQIDSVNVLARTHYLPAFSRLGPYPRALLEVEAWGRKPSL